MKKKNNLIIILVVLIPLISLYLKKRNINRNLPFVFERELSPNSFLKQEKIIPFEGNLNQKSFLINDSMFILNTQEGKMASFISWNFETGILDTVQREVDSYLLINSIRNNRCLYVDRFKIKSIDFINSSTDSIVLNNISTYSIFECQDESFLMLGYQKDANETAFYKVIQGQPVLLKEIRKEKINDESRKFINNLLYNGEFSEIGNYIIYKCDLQSLIFLFDLKGNYITTIKTKENVPEPSITVFNDMYVYTRGRTFNSNVGAFVCKEYLNVISYRSNEDRRVVVDRYSISNGNYIDSFVLDDLRCSNREINQVFQTKDLVIFWGKEKIYFYTLT